MAQKNKHTDGPWSVMHGRGCIHVMSADGLFQTGCISFDGKHEANAHLIAAAPDLLDALRAFCGDHESTGFACAGLNAAYQHARVVIAKAEGADTAHGQDPAEILNALTKP